MPDSYNWMQPGNYDWMQTGNSYGGGDAGPQDNPGNSMFGLESMAPTWQNETGFQGDPFVNYGGSAEQGFNTAFNPEYQQYLQNNGYTFAPGYGGGGTLSSLFKNNQYQGTKQVTNGDQPFGTVMNTLGSMFLGGPMGPGEALGLGGTGAGMLGGGVQGGMTGGASGALRGAVQGGLGGANPAGMVGIENPTLGQAFNRATGSTVGAIARGASGREALQAGLGSALNSGLNAAGSFVGDMFSQFGGDDEFGNLPGNMVTGDDPYNATPEMYSDDGARFDNSADFSYGYPAQQSNGSSELPQQQPLGFSPMSANFSMPSMSSAGNFIGSNFGELATGLYGIVNNRRQQKAIGNQMNQMQAWYDKNAQTNQTAMKTLEDLYSNNSPYATQLRNKLTAQAAATGRRSNLAGRETQLQASLADKYASILPQLTSMQNQQNSMGSALAQANLQAQSQRGLLQNRLMGNLLNMGNQTGLFKGLGNMFNPYNNNLSGYNNGGGM